MGIDYQNENNIGWYLMAAAIVREQVNDLSYELLRIHERVIQDKTIKTIRYANLGTYKGLYVHFENGKRVYSADGALKFLQSEWCKYLAQGSGTDQLINLAFHIERRTYFLKWLRDRKIYKPKEMQIHAKHTSKLPIRTKEEWAKAGYKPKSKEKPYKEVAFSLENGEIHWKITDFYLKEQVKKHV